MRGDQPVKQTILLVDDERNALAAMKRSLRRKAREWDVLCAEHAEEAWRMIYDPGCDAIVTDVCMPGLSGLELLERIKTTDSTRDLPVAVVTGLNDQELKAKALERGATDLLNKPVDADQLIVRLNNMLRDKAALDELRASNAVLHQRLHLQMAALNQSRMAAICRLAMAAEFRDQCTGMHVERVAHYAKAVANFLGMPHEFQEQLLLAAPLHDIGKIAIPDRILFKPGPLTEGERAVMQRHCKYGEMILRQPTELVETLDAGSCDARDLLDDPVVGLAATIALTHHEKFDGSGYPLKLAGLEIPLPSRIVAVCDVYDALTSARPYRAALPQDDALAIMARTAVRDFDPHVYQAFLEILPALEARVKRIDDKASARLPKGEDLV